MSGFYVLVNNTKTSSTVFLPTDSVVIGNAPKCSKCGKYLGMCPLIGEVVVELELWNNSADDVCFGPGDEILFSSRLKDAFESSHLIGADFRSVKIARVKSHKRGKSTIPQYYLTHISRSRVIVDAAASNIEWEGKIDCEECHLDGIMKRFKQIVLVPGTWNGEDIFFARGLPGIIITSQRFLEICIGIGLPTDFLVPIDKFSIDHYPWENKNT
jgi:hypothetical protein